jgi:hypothetical protein
LDIQIRYRILGRIFDMIGKMKSLDEENRLFLNNFIIIQAKIFFNEMSSIKMSNKPDEQK